MLFAPNGQRSGASRIVLAARRNSSMKSKAAGRLRCRYQATALLTSALAPWWYSTRSALIHHRQKLAMQFFPRDGHGLTRFEVCDST